MNFLQYNGFGFISVTPDKVSVTITAVQDEREITRTIEKPFSDPPGIDRTYNYSVGVWIEAGQPSRITVHELSTPISRNLMALVTVKETIKAVIEFILASSQPVGN